MNLSLSARKSSLALCGLVLGWTHAGAQTPNGTQIIGYNNNGVNTNVFTDLQNSPFTTFIDGFFQPTGSSTASDPALVFDTIGQANGPIPSTKVTAFNQVESAGKNVLLSFGGQGAASYYSAFANPGTASNGNSYTAAQATRTLASYLAAYVTGGSSYTNYALNPAGQTVNIQTYAGSTPFRGFSGIDLDFEDTQSFTAGGTYNGATFVSQLTIDLRNQFNALGKPNAIITQAPQTPYLDPNFTQGGGSYAATGAYRAIFAGNGPGTANAATNWLNVQFYNNSVDDGGGTVSGVVQAFERLVTANPDISPSKFVLTLPINSRDANTNNQFTNAQLTEIVREINGWLQSQGKGTIAGLAGFQLYVDGESQSQMDATNLAFANAFLAGVPEPSTWAFVACGVGLLGWTLQRRRISNAGL